MTPLEGSAARREDIVPIVIALAALPVMALLLLAVARLEGSMDHPKQRSPGSDQRI
jgi:hypothetical protein